MANVVIVGMQWGDEGKGKIVDLLSPAFDVAVRYQGGDNAGHTVRFGGQHFALHLIPSGILHPGLQCVLGNGMVVAPEAFLGELAKLGESGVRVDGRLHVARRAHVILPAHVALDQAREQAAGAGKIGTTARGIGPAYECKASRVGLRLGDLAEPDLEDRLRGQLSRIESELLALGAPPLGHPGPQADLCRSWAEKLAPYLTDTELLLNDWLAQGKNLLFEGAQGTLLDLDHGTFPFVTSSNSTAGGACTGTGVPPTAIDGAIGVVKAYTTRVGGGPFPSEVSGESADFLRQRGNEYGTTTGRPRRCGWFDAVVARYARRVNGIGVVAVTKLDVLDRLAEIPVCIGYRWRGEVLREFPFRLRVLEEAQPLYKVLKGWQEETAGILELERLPAAAREYLDFLEQEMEAPVGIVSTGPRREETILRHDVVPLAQMTSGRLAEVQAQRVPE